MQPENLNVGVVAQPEGPKKNRSSLITIIVLATMVVFSLILNIVLALNGKKDDTSGVVAFNNPVVENADGTWAEYFESTRLFVDGTKTVNLALNGGEIVECAIQGLVEVPTEDGKGTMTEGESVSCIVSGLIQDVYKVVEFGKGSSPEEFYIGFITTDGSVYYVKTKDAISNNNFAVKGPVNVGGYVVDVIKIDVLPTDENPGGEISSVFVMRDGSLVEFDSSMLK